MHGQQNVKKKKKNFIVSSKQLIDINSNIKRTSRNGGHHWTQMSARGVQKCRRGNEKAQENSNDVKFYRFFGDGQL